MTQVIPGIVAASAAIPAPPMPAMSHTAYGQFTITNYDAGQTYTLSGGSRSGAVVTLGSVNQIVTVKASYGGGPFSPIATVERKAYTYTTVGPVESYEVSVGAGCPGGWNYEEYGGWAAYCRRYESSKNPTPAGYYDSFGEWWKIT